MVERYTKLRLSKWTDRLPALGALAEEYARRHSLAHYYVGLWADELLWQLLWSPLRDEAPPRRTEEYCGPTWSWCSLIEAHVFMHSIRAAEYLITSVLVEVRVNLLSSLNPYGQVTSAWLKLRGRTRELSKTEYIRKSTSPYLSESDDVDSSLTTTAVPYIHAFNLHFDEHREWPADLNVPLLTFEIGRFVHIERIPGRDEEERPWVSALVLQDMPSRAGSLTYQRVGSLITEPALFDHGTAAEREVIIL